MPKNHNFARHKHAFHHKAPVHEPWLGVRHDARTGARLSHTQLTALRSGSGARGACTCQRAVELVTRTALFQPNGGPKRHWIPSSAHAERGSTWASPPF